MTNRARRLLRLTRFEPARLFRHLAGRRGLILAVSGGADSTALMVLVARWRKRPPVLVVSVDHGLRPEAAAEARHGRGERRAARASLADHDGAEAKAGGNLQDWARRARYRFSSTPPSEAGFDTIVTAHHQDDQAETFLLRLARGSGVYGLAAMPEEGDRRRASRLRARCSRVPRRALREIAAASGLPIVDDPSNADLRFDRVRVRAAMPELAKIGLTRGAARGDRGASRPRRRRRSTTTPTRLLKERFAADPFGVVSGAASALADVPEEVALRALALILKAVGGADYTPRLDAVEGLRAAILAAGDGEKLRRTLSGVVVSVAGGQAVGAPRMGAERSRRRRCAGRRDAALGPAVRGRRCRALKGALSSARSARSKRRLRAAAAERGAVQALPGLYRNGTLVAVPPAVSAADEGAPLAGLAVACVVGRRLGIPAETAATGA